WAVMTFLGLLLLLVWLDDGGTTALLYGVGLGIPGLVLLLGGGWALLARVGIVEQGPVARLRRWHGSQQ
ncbi:MAG: hypothetical protein ABEK12_02575, partial [Candidatus Nanohaloarchaea archaeon]